MRAAGRAPSPPALTRPVLATCAKGGRPLVGDEAQKSAPDVHGQPRQQIALVTRRHQLGAVAAAALASLASPLPEALAADDFITTPSGLRYLDLRPGEGATPQPGDVCVVDWAGYTKGYQGKRIGNTTKSDEPYVFTLGAHEAIPAFEEAVATMRAGGTRRIEVPGSRPELGYARDRSQRFTDDRSSSRTQLFQYRRGPQPAELGGQRALDFVLDAETLQDFNRTLLFDIKLLSVRRG